MKEISQKSAKNTKTKLTCLSEAHPAKTSPLPVKEPDLTENVPLSPSTLYALLTNRNASGLSGKTSREYSAPTKGEISQPFYPSLPEPKLESPKKDGGQLDLFAMLDATDTEWHGELWTDSLPEHPDFLSPYPSADGVCSLSDILVTGPVPLKYYLSRDACAGILRRAESRGVSLPEPLKSSVLIGATITKHTQESRLIPAMCVAHCNPISEQGEIQSQ